jgi:hypothetical protein
MDVPDVECSLFWEDKVIGEEPFLSELIRFFSDFALFHEDSTLETGIVHSLACFKMCPTSGKINLSVHS